MLTPNRSRIAFGLRESASAAIPNCAKVCSINYGGLQKREALSGLRDVFLLLFRQLLIQM